jgi:large subunit ribosomal protein L32e
MSQKLTTEQEQALKLRSRLKSKKPAFRRQESWRYKRVSQVWRKPDGVDSKMRRKVRGWPAQAEIGYRGPRKARNLHPSGYKEVSVRNVDDLAKVDPSTQAVRISHTVGMKKRAEIHVRAGEGHIHILNPLPEEKPAEEEEKEAETEETVSEEGEKTEEEETVTEAKNKGDRTRKQPEEEDKT